MRSTITLNGQESTEIEGLLIQSLPPISKPLVRTEIEEIDGRDGDIVTNLGFSAYKKEFTIGLYGNFDIDEVIAYFNSEGTVTFSNEPDKYYNYQIIDQIDFERLIRFRTATVTMHVQPFKYSTEEKARTFTVTGSSDIFDATELEQGNLTNPNLTTRVHFESESYPVGTTFTITSNNSDIGFGACIFVNGEMLANSGWLEGSYTFTSRYEGALGLNIRYTDDSAITPSDVTDEDITISVGSTIKISNNGNYFSRPQITLTGTGTINLSLNGNQLFVVDLGSTSSTITIDTNAMEAYSGTTLKNRSVDGDYDNFKLNVGSNTLSWSGNLASISINNYSRWI